MRLGPLDNIRRWHAASKCGQFVVLRLGELGHEQQVIADDVALRQAAQSRGAFGEDALALRHPQTRDGRLVERLDFTGLQNTLRHAVASIAGSAGGATMCPARSIIGWFNLPLYDKKH